MCAVCVNCGRCQGIEPPKIEPGFCPMCHHQNAACAVVCQGCGAPLPRIPGAPSEPEAAEPANGAEA